MSKRPILRGRELSDPELDMLRQQLERFDAIDAVDDDLRKLIEERWPHLLAKIRATRH